MRIQTCFLHAKSKIVVRAYLDDVQPVGSIIGAAMLKFRARFSRRRGAGDGG